MTHNSEFDKLDKAIIDSITKHPGGMFMNVHAGRVADEAAKLDPRNPDKMTFRRMRELEKDKKIYQEKRQWYPGSK